MSPESTLFRIRAMTVTDLDKVIVIAESLKDAPKWPREAYLRALDPEGTVPRLSLVAEDQGHGMVGFAIASVAPPDAELETIAVAAASQRRGVARQLFDEMSRLLRGAGVTTIALEVRGSNVPALSLYKGLGFHEVGKRQGYYIDPVDDAILMRLRFE